MTIPLKKERERESSDVEASYDRPTNLGFPHIAFDIVSLVRAAPDCPGSKKKKEKLGPTKTRSKGFDCIFLFPSWTRRSSAITILIRCEDYYTRQEPMINGAHSTGIICLRCPFYTLLPYGLHVRDALLENRLVCVIIY